MSLHYKPTDVCSIQIGCQERCKIELKPPTEIIVVGNNEKEVRQLVADEEVRFPKL